MVQEKNLQQQTQHKVNIYEKNHDDDDHDATRLRTNLDIHCAENLCDEK